MFILNFFVFTNDKDDKEQITSIFSDPFFLKKKQPDKKTRQENSQLSRLELKSLLGTTDLLNTDSNTFFVNSEKEKYKVGTSIDVYLQEYLLSILDRLKALSRGKPQRIAFVVMEADTGKIIAMTGFDLDSPQKNPCIVSNYPAASVFKIITAAAAIETLGYTSHTSMYFNGSKYTLYKRQLKNVKNKYTSKISFSKAFAESINPVFGKLGKNNLGKDRLKRYADAFGFNQEVNSEFEFDSGFVDVTDNPYRLAELGCGFNTETTISPVFAAMLSCTIVNSGNSLLPSIVEHVTDSKGKLLYQGKKTTYKIAIKPKTAKTVMKMMETTISRGTAKKAFRGFSKEATLSNLIIGGKTGSLYNKDHTVKYDWFTGFGKEKKGNKKIALSVVVGHRKYIGTRASEYGKMILKQYFKKPYKTAQL
ncbi:MAG: PbpA [Desulfobacula sp.]|nr:PbpA [Desulfobacula sp.]